MKGLATSGMMRMVVLPFSAVCAVLTARITISSTGVEFYGYINTVAMLFMLIPFADLGVGATMSTAVARRHITPDGVEKMYAALLGSVRVLATAAAAMTAVTVVVVYSGLLSDWLGLPPEVAEDGRTPMFLALFAFFCSVPIGIGFRMLIGSGNNTLLAMGTIIAPATTVTYSYCVSLMDGPPLLFAMGPALGVVLTNLFGTACAMRILRLPVLQLLRDLPRRRTRPGGKVMDTAWPMIMIVSAFALTLYSHRVLLANFSTPTELAIYALAVQLFLPAWSIVYMAGTILWSEFAVSDDRFRTLTQANALLVAVSLCGALGLYLVGPLLVRVMNPDGNLTSAPTLLAFGALMVVMGLDLTQTMLLVSAGQLRTRALWAAAATLAFAVLCVPAIRAGGDAGIIWLTAGVFFVFQTLPNLLAGFREVRPGTRVPEPVSSDH